MSDRGRTTAGWELLSGAVKGVAKKHSQDSSVARLLPLDGGPAVVLAVADGHGSAPHFRSDLGASWAVEEFTVCAEAFGREVLRHGGDAARWPGLLALARRLPHWVVHRWRARVLLHDANSPAHGNPYGSPFPTAPPAPGPPALPAGPSVLSMPPAADSVVDLTAYGSTLVGAVVTEHLLVCWQLGDGDVVLVDDSGAPHTPFFTGPEFGDETDSLCEEDAWRKARLFWRPLPGGAPPAVLLSTDGLSKSFADHHKFLDFATGVRTRVVEQGIGTVQEQLADWLKRAAGYSGDDTTLVGVFPAGRPGAGLRTDDKDATGSTDPVCIDQTGRPGRMATSARTAQTEGNSTVNGMLAAGQKLVTESGDSIKVAELFGSGGQGEVYRVSTPHGDRALKWYFPQLATARQHEILQGLIERGWADDRFLWPQTTVMDPSGRHPGFGYLMDVRPARFHDLPALFRRDPAVAGVTVRSLLTAALHTVEAYRTLHSRGIAYRDINWGNVFFDPATGSVLICDNDNAVVEGEDAGVAGTLDFMAPELVRGDAGVRPGIQSDLHSLAVLLFMLLMTGHPLDGAAEYRIHCKGPEAKAQLYGTDPVFVYDPNDTRNRPDPDDHRVVIASWKVLPQILKDLFVKTFTEGLANPSRRVRETQWRNALGRVLDAIVVCQSCGRQNLTQPDGALPQCWHPKCGTQLRQPPSLEIVTGTGALRSHRTVRLAPGTRLYAHHLIDDPERHDFSAVVAEVTAHPTRPGRYGLTNRTDGDTWTVRQNDGTVQNVPPGRTAGLRAGLLLEFGGGAEGNVRG